MKWVCNIYDRCNSGRCGEVLLNRQREFFVKLEHECLLQALEWSASEGFFFKVRLHPGHREPVVVHVRNQRSNSFDALQNSGSLDKMNLKPLEGEIYVHTVHREYHHLENIWYHSWTRSWHLYTSENWRSYIIATATTKKQPCENDIDSNCQVKIWNMLHPRKLTCPLKSD